MSNLKEIQQIQSLIAKGKGMGYLTFDEVNKALPVEMNTPEQFEEIIGIFEQLEIAIVDSEKDGKKISATPTETDDDAMDSSLELTEDRRLFLAQHRPGAHVPARDGRRAPAGPRR